MAKVLQIHVVSTRPGRVGPHVGRWFEQQARAHGGFEVDVVDYLEQALPLFDEAAHPRLGRYEHAHTKAWSARLKQADAIAFVTPEYNFGAPPSLVNALTFLASEWAYLPVGFVSYGGVSAGTRSVQMSKQIVTTLKMMPLPEAVAIPFYSQFLKDGVFDPGEQQAKAAVGLLDELGRWSQALAELRAGVRR